MSGRNNPLIPLLGMPFDTFNLLHRWFGRIVIVEGVAHTIAHLWASASTGSWATAWATAWKVPFMMWGFIVRFILFLSSSPSACLLPGIMFARAMLMEIRPRLRLLPSYSKLLAPSDTLSTKRSRFSTSSLPSPRSSVSGIT